MPDPQPQKPEPRELPVPEPDGFDLVEIVTDDDTSLDPVRPFTRPRVRIEEVDFSMFKPQPKVER